MFLCKKSFFDFLSQDFHAFNYLITLILHMFCRVHLNIKCTFFLWYFLLERFIYELLQIIAWFISFYFLQILLYYLTTSRFYHQIRIRDSLVQLKIIIFIDSHISSLCLSQVYTYEIWVILFHISIIHW